MLNRHDLYSPGLFLQIAVVVAAGLLLGITCVWLSPIWIVSLAIGAGLAFATIKRPEIALLVILVATSSIIFEDQLPLLSIGIGSLNISDILLLEMFGLIAVRWLAKPGFKIVRTPLDWPLLVFYGVTLFSTFIAIYQSSVDVLVARRAFRVLSYYLIFFIVTNLVRERRQLNFLLNGLFLLATIVAAAMVLQYLLGDSVQLLPGRVETLDTQGTIYWGVTRLYPPGFSIVLVSFMAILCILVVEKFKPLGLLKFLQLGLLGIALLFTFLRSYWAALIIVFVLLVYLVRGANRLRIVGWSLLVISLVTMILLFGFRDPGSETASLVSGSIDRFNTLLKIGTFQGQDSSLRWRMIENGYAFSSISAHPLIGMGMGFTYRPWDSRLDGPHPPSSSLDFRTFIHNGHLWILLQSGLLGYLSLMWLSLAFLIRGFRNWRSIANDRMRGIVLGFTLVYLAILIAAVANSTFMQWFWAPVIGIIMGTNEVVLSKFGQDASGA